MPSLAARAERCRLSVLASGWHGDCSGNAERAGRPASQGASNMDRIRLFGMLAAAAAATLTVSPVGAETDVKFALDWKFEGPSAPYFVAIDKGYYKAEGLNVTIDSGPGSVAGIARVAAGTYPIGFFDINSLVKFRDQNPDKKVQAVLMIYDKPAFAIGTTAKTGIAKPKDLEGRVLGAPTADGAFAQWKAFVKENGIDESKVKIENVGFPVREPMLAEGKVDAITGFSFSMYYNLLQKGIKPDDIKIMLMADYGLVLYTIKDPDTAIRSVMARNETADPKIELDRLKMSLRDNFVTPWVKANGFGGVDMTRLAKSIDQIGLTYEFKNRPTAEDIFTSQYLPPAAERKL